MSGHFVQKGFDGADEATVADRPTHNLTEDVTAPLVGGQDAIGDQESCGAGMVRDDAKGCGTSPLLLCDLFLQIHTAKMGRSLQ